MCSVSEGLLPVTTPLLSAEPMLISHVLASAMLLLLLSLETSEVLQTCQHALKRRQQRAENLGLTSCVHTRLCMATPACAHRVEQSDGNHVRIACQLLTDAGVQQIAGRNAHN